MMIYNLPNNSVVKVHDIFDPLPIFMKKADTLFIDPPYNQSLLSNFINRDGIAKSFQNKGLFSGFIDKLFECIKWINPNTLFLEMGKDYLSMCMEKCKPLFPYITFYNSTYYHRQQNKCYVIHATQSAKNRRYKNLEDLDEEDIIKWICNNHRYECIGDLCMGQGLVGKYAYLAGRSFVGTELNKKRLAVLVDFIEKQEVKKGEQS